MSKKIIINNCYECHYFIKINCEKAYCSDTHKYFNLKDIEKKIPNFCRLEDDNENKNE